MSDDETQHPDCDPNAIGIIHCLHMLAEEAGSLQLARTMRALREAIAICEAERPPVAGLSRDGVGSGQRGEPATPGGAASGRRNLLH